MAYIIKFALDIPKQKFGITGTTSIELLGLIAARWSSWHHRTSQNAPVVDRVVSHVTITDPRHSFFGQRLVVLGERSGRGPGYVAVELPDGRRRSVRKTATDLVVPSQPVGSNLPRISIRTLIPLAQDRLADRRD